MNQHRGISQHNVEQKKPDTKEYILYNQSHSYAIEEANLTHGIKILL